MPSLLGGVTVVNNKGINVEELPQDVASAWSVADQELKKLTGASYKLRDYIGYQTVSGTNFVFTMTQTMQTNPATYHIVEVRVNLSSNGTTALFAVKTTKKSDASIDRKILSIHI